MHFVGGQPDLSQRDGQINTGAPPGVVSATSVTILPNRSGGIAPAGVFFEMVTAGFAVTRPHHDLRVKWQFDDAGDFTALDADHPQGQGRTTSYGPMTAHCFETPGTYVVTCEVTDGSDTSLSAFVVNVTDPDAVFAGPQTYVVASGAVTGAPTGALNFTTLAAAKADAIAAGRRSVRFLFAADEVHNISGVDVFGSGDFDNLYFGPIGTGTQPVLNDTLQAEGAGSGGEVVITGLSLQGPFDPTIGGSVSADGVVVASAEFTTVHQVTVAGFDTCVRPAIGQGGVIVSDSVVRDWAQTGIWHSGADQSAIIGSTIVMDDDTIAAEVADAPVRLDGTLGRYVMWKADMFSAGGAGAHAPAFRWNADGQSGATGVIGACRMEGGTPVLQIAPDGAGPDRAGNLVVEKSYLLGTAATGNAGIVALTFGGTSLRNSVLVMPDVAPESGTDAPAFVTGTADQTNGANDAAPVEIYSNSLIDLRSPATLANNGQSFAEYVTSDFAHWGALVVEDNLTHGPNLQLPITLHDPINDTSVFAPRYKGLRTGGGLDANFATPATTAALYQPIAKGSTVDSAGIAKRALDDFASVLRDLTPEVGAHELVTSVTLSQLTDGQYAITGLINGKVDITVTEPAEFAGSYTVDLTELDTHPVVLVPPAVNGDVAVGNTVTGTPGLTVFKPGQGTPMSSFQWLLGNSQIAGATNASYVVQSGDDAIGLSLQEQVINASPEPGVGIREVIASQPYTDRGQVFATANQLTRTSNLGLAAPGVDHLVVFFSFIPQTSGKNIFVKFNSTDKADLRRQSNNALAIGATRSSGTSNAASPSGQIANGVRYNILAYIGAGGIKMMLQAGSDIPETVINSGSDFSGIRLNYDTRILHEADAATVFRAGIWLPSGVFDPLDLGNFRAFANVDGTTVAPTTGDTLLNTADLATVYGSAAEYNAGLGGLWTPTGTFSDA